MKSRKGEMGLPGNTRGLAWIFLLCEQLQIFVKNLAKADCRLAQCFSTFVRPRLGKFFFHKTRARSEQIYS